MPEHRYLPFLKDVLTPARLDHTLGVVQVMGELAEVYGLDTELAQTIGILHDAGKDLSPVQQEVLIVEGKIERQHPCESDYVHYLHGAVGSYFVQQELGIRDPWILDAITSHTYMGDSPYFDDPHYWCLRFADLLEPTRDWRGQPMILAAAKKIRELAYAGMMAEAALLQTRTLITWFSQRGIAVHPNMYRVERALSTATNHSGLPPAQVAALLNRSVSSFPHEPCKTCECFLGYVTQLEIDADRLGQAFLQRYKPKRTAVHSCLGCNPCPPGDQFAVYLRGNIP